MLSKTTEIGSLYDMRGKRFLDAVLVPNKHGTNDLSFSDIALALPSYSSPSTSLSWGLSWYMGSNGSNNGSANSNNNSSNNNYNKSK